jgi:hypothetical protein
MHWIFLRADIHELRQVGNEATVEFIRVIDHLFDLLNSHSPFAKGPKAPLRIANMQYWKTLLIEFKDYIAKLKSGDGILLLHHRRKTAFVGFTISQ